MTRYQFELKGFFNHRLLKLAVNAENNCFYVGRLVMKSSKIFLLLCSLFLMFASMTGVIVGCGGSGGGGGGGTNNLDPGQTQTSNLQFSKSAYNFGNVTLGNAATLSVVVNNTGTTNLSITDLTLSDNNNFAIDQSAWGSGPHTVAAGMSGTIMVTFSPTVEASYSETLSITSDDAVNPTVAVALTGEGEAVSAYSVALNQVETDCSTNTVTAYVSVTDQDGFAVTDLTVSDFQISEDGGAPIVPGSVNFAKNTSLPLAVAVVMDYSGSIYESPNLIETIEDSVANFAGAIGAIDQTEIIKFASLVQRIQGFTTDRDLLDAAIYQVPVGLGTYTALYDAIYQGIDDVAQTHASRRAVLVLTDGHNNNQAGGHILDEVINLGKDSGVPVFTVRVGNDEYVDLLRQIASETGGQFFDSPDMDRVRTIYSQLSKILNNQYILTYPSVGTGADVSTVVSISHGTADGGTISNNSNVLSYPSCP
jgi:Ca-activated chloride channel homolog